MPATQTPRTTENWPCIACGDTDAKLRDLPLRHTQPDVCTVCGPCWAAFGGTSDAYEIGAAPLTAGPVRDPYSQGEWLKLLEADPWVQRLRRDARRRLLALARTLRNFADWETFENRPTWPVLCAASGWARSTMASWLRQLRVTGWLTIIESGTTQRFRPMGSPLEGNRAAVYGLRIPLRADLALREQLAKDAMNERHQDAQAAGTAPAALATFAQLSGAEEKTWTPSWSFKTLKESFVCGSSRARDFFHSQDTPVWAAWPTTTNEALRAQAFEKEQLGFQWLDRSPSNRAEAYAAACELRCQHPVLARLSPRAIRNLARPFWRIGWSNADFLHGLDWHPTSRSTVSGPAEYSVIHPLGWCRARLSAWLDDTGRPLRGQSHRRAAAAARRTALTSDYGKAGERLLTRGSGPLPDRVAEYGRQCARQLARDEHRRLTAQRQADVAAERQRITGTNPPEIVASDETRRAEKIAFAEAEQRRRQRRRAEELRHELVAKANDHKAASAAPTPSPTAAVADPVLADSALSPYERAKRKSRGEGRVSDFGRRRPRW